MGVMTFLGSVSIIISLLPRFDEPKYRVHRMATFLCFGVSGAIPMVHCVISDGMEYQIQSAGIGWMMAMGATYIVGAILYGARIPERFFPGKCDLVVSYQYV